MVRNELCSPIQLLRQAHSVKMAAKVKAENEAHRFMDRGYGGDVQGFLQTLKTKYRTSFRAWRLAFCGDQLPKAGDEIADKTAGAPMSENQPLLLVCNKVPGADSCLRLIGFPKFTSGCRKAGYTGEMKTLWEKFTKIWDRVQKSEKQGALGATKSSGSSNSGKRSKSADGGILKSGKSADGGSGGGNNSSGNNGNKKPLNQMTSKELKQAQGFKLRIKSNISFIDFEPESAMIMHTFATMLLSEVYHVCGRDPEFVGQHGSIHTVSGLRSGVERVFFGKVGEQHRWQDFYSAFCMLCDAFTRRKTIMLASGRVIVERDAWDLNDRWEKQRLEGSGGSGTDNQSNARFAAPPGVSKKFTDRGKKAVQGFQLTEGKERAKLVDVLQEIDPFFIQITRPKKQCRLLFDNLDFGGDFAISADEVMLSLGFVDHERMKDQKEAGVLQEIGKSYDKFLKREAVRLQNFLAPTGGGAELSLKPGIQRFGTVVPLVGCTPVNGPATQYDLEAAEKRKLKATGIWGSLRKMGTSGLSGLSGGSSPNTSPTDSNVSMSPLGCGNGSGVVEHTQNQVLKRRREMSKTQRLEKEIDWFVEEEYKKFNTMAQARLCCGGPRKQGGSGECYNYINEIVDVLLS
jgi:hypothetical protein